MAGKNMAEEQVPTVDLSTSKIAETAGSKGSKARQLLGMKGAQAGETSIWKIRLQLMKPITWIPLIWGVVCGAASSGRYVWTVENVLIAAACMLMSGPLLTGYTQTINDYYDRELDAINEPNRPIPSGAISLNQVQVQIWVLLLGGLAVSYGLDIWAGHTFPVLFFAGLWRLIGFLIFIPPHPSSLSKMAGQVTMPWVQVTSRCLGGPVMRCLVN